MSRSRLPVLMLAIFLVVAVVAAGIALPSVIAAAPARAAAAAGQVAAVSSPSTARTVSTQAATAQPVITIQPGADSESQILEAIYQKVNPSVVQIVNLAQTQTGGRFSNNSTAVLPQGEGSGFVWDTQGNIVTNDHVVQGADQLQVVFADGTTVSGTLVGTDPNSDLAVVRVDPKLVSLVPVEQGDMAQVKVGELAVAIGNPFGFQGTMTRGIVSALGRTIPSQTTYQIPEAIQTDAAINPGNSGGPLLNEQGQVIGVNDQIQSSTGSSSGVGFSIPISIVQRVVPSLIQTGKYSHAYLGVGGATFSPDWAQALGLPANARGVYLEAVTPGGPAATAGLVAGTQPTTIVLGADRTGVQYLQSGGDLITAIDGQPVTSMDALMIYLEEKASPGQTVRLSIERAGGQLQTINVRLGTRPVDTTTVS